MTDQERAALLAWLDEQIATVNEHLERECLSDNITDHIMGFIDNGSIMAYNAVKAHIESETTHDEALPEKEMKCFNCGIAIPSDEMYLDYDGDSLCEDCWREAGEPIPGVSHDEL